MKCLIISYHSVIDGFLLNGCAVNLAECGTNSGRTDLGGGVPRLPKYTRGPMGLFSHVAHIRFTISTPANVAEVFEAIKAAMEDEGHCSVLEDECGASSATLVGIWTSGCFHFKDDMRFEIEVQDNNGVVVNGHSCSRIGKGDMYANKKHLLSLLRRSKLEHTRQILKS